MARLGGDVGLSAAMVVANGILIQMLLGLGTGDWLEGWVKRLERRTQDEENPEDTQNADTRNTMAIEDADAHSTLGIAATDPRTVAAGVTVGINAAAMGTAHLYEVRSDAAPYAALSMTVFGVATVGFTLAPQIASWVINSIK
jgi:hypothetical protein